MDKTTGYENLIPAKPGEVRNPAGKPKGTLNRSTLYKKWLEVADAEGLTEADKIVLAQITKAKTGDTTAAAHVIDSAMGKLTDKQELTGSNGNPLAVILGSLDGSTAGLPDGE